MPLVTKLCIKLQSARRQTTNMRKLWAIAILAVFILAGVTFAEEEFFIDIDRTGPTDFKFSYALSDAHPGTIPLRGKLKGKAKVIWAVFYTDMVLRFEDNQALETNLIVTKPGKVTVVLVATNNKQVKLVTGYYTVQDSSSKQ